MKEYDDLLKGVNTFLKKFHFSRKGVNFIRENENFYDVINFQRSSSSTKDNALFTINVGVISKKILEHKKFKFFYNLNHNQWDTRIDSITGNREFSWMAVNKTVNVDGLKKKLENIFIQYVFSALQKHNDERYIAEKLLAQIISAKSLILGTAEYLLIIITRSFPDK